MRLDEYDRKILTVVQQDATLSFAKIGERVHLSPSAVLRRIARLKEAGVITGTFLAVDPKIVGRPITIIVEITLENESADLLGRTKSALAAAPEVQHCFYVTGGDIDIVAILNTSDLDAYEIFTQRVLRGNSNIKRFRTSVVTDRIKSTMFVPV